MLGFFSSKKENESFSLPPLFKKPTSVADETFGVDDDDGTIDTQKKKGKDDIDNESEDNTKPLYHDAWIRSLDPQKNIYFYNARTGESSWLGPCGICCKPADKYCIDCGTSLCDKDFKKRHEKRSRQKHHWQLTDIPNPSKLKQNEVYCLECSLKTATIMCMDCWDGYCPSCFDIVHFVGALKHHKRMPYLEAKRGWICVHGESIKDVEYYVNGETGVSTYEKPIELMSPLEKRLHKEFKKAEAAAQKAVTEIEQLQFEVEGTKFERDKVLEESIGALRELHSKHLEKSKVKEGNQLDHSKVKGGGGLLGMLFGVNAKQELYIDRLLNPTDRRRGEARTQYIKEVLDESTAPLAPVGKTKETAAAGRQNLKMPT